MIQNYTKHQKTIKYIKPNAHIYTKFIFLILSKYKKMSTSSIKCLRNIDRYLVETSSVYLMDENEKAKYTKTTQDSIKISDIICSECSLNKRLCAGHMTSIHFMYPIINPLFIDKLANIVFLMCFECGQPYFADSISNTLSNAIRNKKPFKSAIDYLKDQLVKKLTNCSSCARSVKIFDIKYLKANNIFVYDQNTQRYTMPMDKVKSLLNTMKNYESSMHLLSLLDIDRNVSIEEFLPNIILVTPLRDRPMSITGGDNPLTDLYLKLLKQSENMNTIVDFNVMNLKTADVSKLYKKLLFGEQITRSSKDFINGIIPEIKGKAGHKKVLASIKVSNAKRTVASGHPGDSSIVIVPKAIMNTTPYPILVTEENIQEFTEMLKRKEIISVKPRESNLSGQIFHPKFLRINDVVMRPLRDGDLCLINRQPEVHGGSIIVLKIIGATDNSKTLTVAITKTDSLGLDFDGDEINIIVPQTLEAVRELEEFQYSDQTIVKPGNSSAMMGIQFSCITSCYLLTSREDMTPVEFFNTISLILLPKNNPLKDINKFPIVHRYSTRRSSQYAINISEYLEDIDIVNRSIDQGLLNPDMFFIEISALGLNYYYDINVDHSDVNMRIEEHYNLLLSMFSDFNLFFEALLNSLRINTDMFNIIKDIIESKSEGYLIYMFKIIDFAIKERLEEFCLDLPKIKIAKIRGTYVQVSDPVDSYYRDDFYIDDKINYKTFFELCSVVGKCKDFIVDNIVGIIPGRFVFSISLPKYLNYDQSGVKIVKGVNIHGVIESTHISTSRQSILLYIAKSYRKRDSEYIQDSINFIDILNRMLVSFYNYFGFTYCFENITGNVRAYHKYDKIIQEEKIKTYADIDVTLDAILRNNDDIIPSGLEWSNFQNKILNTLKSKINRLRQTMSQYINYHDVDKFSKSGAKGKRLNNDQITFAIGDLFVAGDLYIRQNPNVLDRTTLSYTLDSYIDGFDSWIEYMQVLSARNAIVLRHTAVPTSEYASSTNGIILNKTTTTEDMSTIKITGKYGVKGPHQVTLQWHYGGYGVDTTRLLSQGESYYFTDIDSLFESAF